MNPNGETKLTDPDVYDNWDRLSPAYKIEFEQRLARWYTEDREAQVSDLRFFKAFRKTVEQDCLLNRIDMSDWQDVLDDCDKQIEMLVEKLM